LRKSEMMLEEDAMRFDAFLKENDRKAHDALKRYMRVCVCACVCVLQWCYNNSALVLQWSCCGVTVGMMWRFNSVF
jgi:hypothetical protein